jgi:hypothetical protein
MVANTLVQPTAFVFSSGNKSRRFVPRVHKHVPNYMDLHSMYLVAVLILANVIRLALLLN